MFGRFLLGVLAPLRSYMSLDGGPLFSAWSLNVYVTFLASVLYSGWVGAGPTCPGTGGRGRVCVPSDVGWSPRGVEMLPAPAGAAGECPPHPYPPERSGSRVGAGGLGGRWGRRGGRRAEAISCPRSARILTIKTRPQVGCLYPGVGLRAARLFVGGWGCPFGGGDLAPGNAPPGA